MFNLFEVFPNETKLASIQPSWQPEEVALSALIRETFEKGLSESLKY